MALIAGAGNPLGSGGAGSTGTGLNYVLDRAYAFSGAVSCDNNETTLLSFTTGAQLINGTIQFFYAEPSNDIFLYTVKLNNELIVRFQVFGPNDTNGEHLLSLPIFLIVPPFSKVELLAKNNENTNARDQCGNFTGRVYG